ncbi:pepsin-like aspartic protease [Pacificoceanicola onchidii]|uniref:pepsin-like aspartic protease n=1 Tax=Pacificoceanicola onchidii TaxID=2562685 RepID=UPI0010A3C31C|nr:pepsin-like aspartic protease [Pacificoceanicola onchidii]
MAVHPDSPGSFNIAMFCGPYQDNGAAPWYAPLSVGTSDNPQVQYFALDTGTNMDWVTSTLCNTEACLMHPRFDPGLSSTYQQDDEGKVVDLDYGPWGSLQAKIGTDVVNLPGGLSQSLTFGVAVSYSGPQFEEIDWSACLALPAQGEMQQGFTNMMQAMLDEGAVDPNKAWVCFDWNRETKQGSCLIGDVDWSGIDTSQFIALPFDSYTPIPSVDYIWTTAGATVSIGDLTLDDVFFCLDSGSSRFKGGPDTIDKIKANLGGNTNTLTIKVGNALGAESGTLVVPPELYMRTIEEGENAGETLPQFAVLGELPQLLLVGSVIMDYLYTVYVYDYVEVNGEMKAQGVGVVIFNKIGSPAVIQNDNAVTPIKGSDDLRAVFDELTGKGAGA